MARFVVRRLAQMVLVLFAVSVLTFLIFNVIPGGDPAVRMAGTPPGPRPARPTSGRSGASTTRSTSSTSKTMEKTFTGDLFSYTTQHRRGGRASQARSRARSRWRSARRSCGWPWPRRARGLHGGQGGQVRRPLPDDPRARGHLDARLLGRGADELLPGLQMGHLPQRRLRAVHRRPLAVVLPPDHAVDRAVDPVHRRVLARAALEHPRHDQRGLRAHGARQGALRAPGAGASTCCATR